MILTVELELAREKVAPDSYREVAICFDAEGLDRLIGKLQSLRARNDHVHLMTPSWAGDDLTEEKQGGPQYTLVNHLRLVRINGKRD